MDENVRSFCNSGADQEQTLEENRAAYFRLRLLPRVLRDVAHRRMEVTLLGDMTLSMPVGISPTALQKLAHRDGEVATARAAHAEGTLMILSSYSSTSMEAVRKEVPEGLRWFQLQIAIDRDLTKCLVKRAERAGYRALVLTVDEPVFGRKITRVKKRYSHPNGVKYANLEGTSHDEYADAKAAMSMTDPFVDASQSWDDVTWLKSITHLPVVAKGITTAAHAEGTLMILSSYSSTSMEAVRKEVPEGLRWFQLQIAIDRDLTKCLVKRAERAGYRALVLTVDEPVFGRKITRVKKRYSHPNGVKYANLEGTSHDEYADAKAAMSMTDPFVDASQSWDDVTWLKSITHLPVVAKGITTAEDAEEAVNRGVSAILVSNHGGRQLDGLPATIEVLPEVVRAVRGRVEVYVDGGVRRGTDVVKALALGAKAVFVGRPVFWGLAYNGEAGVRQTLSILREEVDRALALMVFALPGSFAWNKKKQPELLLSPYFK
ncbi:hydroxyacid oxidase 1 [Ixodes scapularis]